MSDYGAAKWHLERAIAFPSSHACNVRHPKVSVSTRNSTVWEEFPPAIFPSLMHKHAHFILISIEGAFQEHQTHTLSMKGCWSIAMDFFFNTRAFYIYNMYNKNAHLHIFNIEQNTLARVQNLFPIQIKHGNNIWHIAQNILKEEARAGY